MRNKAPVQQRVARFEKEGDMGFVPKRKPTPWQNPNTPDISNDFDELKKRREKSELENAGTKEMSGTLNPPPCAGAAGLANTEKVLTAEGPMTAFGFPLLLQGLILSRSTYYHDKTCLAIPDRHSGLRRLIPRYMGETKVAMGAAVSEKAARCLMAA